MIYGPVALQTISDERTGGPDAEVWLQQPGGEYKYREVGESSLLLCKNPQGLGIPSSDTPSRVTVRFDRQADYEDLGSFTRDLRVSLVVGGVVKPASVSADAHWLTTRGEVAFEFSGAALAGLTGADFDADFGVAIGVSNDDQQNIVLGASVFGATVEVEV